MHAETADKSAFPFRVRDLADGGKASKEFGRALPLMISSVRQTKKQKIFD
jgi:hypothetical protein